ncbi:MAG TPA: MFS transporter [Gaiellaceae bacterium]|nr:MFS transporter [Gaiellaceae bacterium]
MPSLRRPTGGLWSHADFLKLWTGQTISEFGSSVSALAIPWLAGAGLHASPLEFSLLTVLGFLPFILFALPAGVWVDRLRRRPILIVGDSARALLLGYIPVAWALGILTIGQLLVLQFVIGIFTVFFDVAYQSYLPSLVTREQLVEGNSKLQSTAASAGVVGPGIAGVLIGALTAPYAIVVDAASFVLSTAFMIPIRAQEEVPEHAEDAPRPKMLPELKEGLAWVVRHRHLKWIAACTGSSNFFGMISMSIGLLYMQRVLDMSAFWAGVVFAGYGIGSIVGAVTTTKLQRAFGVGPMIWMPAVLFGVGGFAFPLAPHGNVAVPVLLASTLVVGFGGMAYNITQVSYRQAITPQRLQGRMNASMRWIVWGTMPIGSILGGALATATSMHLALWVGAIGGGFTFLPVLLSSVRSIAEMPEPEPMPEPTADAGLVTPTTSAATAAADAPA